MTFIPESLLRVVVIATGLLAILVPVARILFSSGRTKMRSTGHGSGFRRWPGVLLITGILLTAGIFLWIPLPLSLPASTMQTLALIGFFIYIPAICLYLWGFLALGSHFAASSLTGADLFAGHQFIRNGPYRFVRHPMYLGVILAAIGAFLFFLTWAMAIFLPLSLVVIARAHQEEKLLESEYGEEWRAYRGQVPMWMPRIFKKDMAESGELPEKCTTRESLNMKRQPAKRYIVRTEEGPPHGDLYELEQTTYHHVIDTHTGQVVLTLRGEMEASLSGETGQWDDYQYSGVSEVTLTPDEKAVRVKYHDGREELVELPGS
jgi:protein-S-isoprenylcysteine O-methyltransferase Ste14